MHKHQGITLIEMIIGLAIIGILAGMVAPTINNVIERNKAANAMNWINRAIRFTRVSAVTHGVMTTLCPSSDGKQCGGKWHEGVLVFTDENADRQINGNDRALLRLVYPYSGTTIKWRSFRNRQYLQISSMGYTNFQNGNFVYCSENQDSQIRPTNRHQHARASKKIL